MASSLRPTSARLSAPKSSSACRRRSSFGLMRPSVARPQPSATSAVSPRRRTPELAREPRRSGRARVSAWPPPRDSRAPARPRAPPCNRRPRRRASARPSGARGNEAAILVDLSHRLTAVEVGTGSKERRPGAAVAEAVIAGSRDAPAACGRSLRRHPIRADRRLVERVDDDLGEEIPRSIGSGVYRVALRNPMVAVPDQPGSVRWPLLVSSAGVRARQLQLDGVPLGAISHSNVDTSASPPAAGGLDRP